MIAKGNLHGSGAYLADYLAKDSKGNERAELAELRGFMAGNLFDALREAHADAELTRAEKPLFHSQVRLPHGEQLTREQWLQVADRIEKRLGFENQPRAIVFHVKDGEEHMHVVWNRIDTERERAIDPGLFKLKLKEACRELEQEMDLRRVRNERDPAERTRAAARDEFEESRRLKTDLKAVREHIRASLDGSDSGKAFTAALAEHRYILAQGDRRDFVVIDDRGGQHALSKRITGLTAGQTRDRLADLDKDELPSVARAQEMQRERMAERDQADASRAVQAAFGLAADEVAKTPEPLQLDDMEPPTVAERADESVARFLARQQREAETRGPEPGVARQFEQVADGIERGAGAAVKTATRAADALGDMADRFMTAAADFLVGTSQPRRITEAEWRASAEARKESARQIAGRMKHRETLERMLADREASRPIDPQQVRYLDYAAQQEIRDRGEPALNEMLDALAEEERRRVRERSMGLERER